jgi:hypothetical protein
MENIMGLLENIDAKLDQIIALLSAGTHTNGAAAAAAHDPFAMPGTGAAPAQTRNYTDTEIMELIQPHLANAVLKASLQAELAAMGINGLPNAQPAQYNEIYQRFQKVIGSAGAGATAGGLSLV